MANIFDSYHLTRKLSF